MWFTNTYCKDLLFSFADTPLLREVYFSCFMQLGRERYAQLREAKAAQLVWLNG